MVGDATLEEVEGGFRVKETATHYLDVIRMLSNWRLCTTSKSCSLTYDRSWCYAGTGIQSLITAVLAAEVWGRI